MHCRRPSELYAQILSLVRFDCSGFVIGLFSARLGFKNLIAPFASGVRLRDKHINRCCRMAAQKDILLKAQGL